MAQVAAFVPFVQTLLYDIPGTLFCLNCILDRQLRRQNAARCFALQALDCKATSLLTVCFLGSR